MRFFEHVTHAGHTIGVCLLLAMFSAIAQAQEGPLLELSSPVGGGVRPSRPAKGVAAPQFNSQNGAANQSPRSIAKEELFVVGRLERVRRDDSGSTRYALINESGQVAAFVAPSARIDLRRYLSTEVGITSKTFTQSDDEPPYVMIERIVPTAAAVERVADVSTSANSDFNSGRPASFGNRQPGPIRQVDHEVIMGGDAMMGNGMVLNDGTVVDEGMLLDGYRGDGGWSDGPSMGPVYEQTYGDPGCTTCGPSGCSPHGANCAIPNCTICSVQPPTCGPPGWLWIRGEYLLWWAQGMRTPPLVTTSPAGTSAGNAGVLPAAEIIYGNEEILTDANSGFRIRFGGFFGPERRWGYEAEYFSLDGNTEMFTASSDGNGMPIIARPFFNVNPPGAVAPFNDSQLIAFPGLLAGDIMVDSFSNFDSAAGKLKFNLCCSCCGSNSCGGTGCGYPPSSRLDLLLGYRYYGLNEGLTIREDLTSLSNVNPGTFDIRDSFTTRNRFNGGEVGLTWEGMRNRWTLELLLNVAIGGTNQQVTIDGETTAAPLVSPATTSSGGLLTQRSNIGTYERSEFTMIPQLNTNLGFYLTPRLRFITGYSLVYWGSVVRPGDQIDLDVNPALLPPESNPFVGPLRPEFAFRDSTYWAQGLNLGLDYRW